MKIFILCLIACFFSAVCLAETPSSENDQISSSTTKEVSPQIKEEKEQAEKLQPKWPRPYAPSEEISADSSVPFPADI